MKSSQWFYRVGASAWVIAIGCILVLGISALFGDYEFTPGRFKRILLVFGVCGLVSFFLGFIHSIWDN